MPNRTSESAANTLAEIDPALPVRQQTYELIRSAIVRTDIQPGATLSENDIANRIGVSRTPVREAIVRLMDEGLVEVRPRIGTLVARLKPVEIREAMFVRDALESAAVHLATERMTPQMLKVLRTNLTQQEKAKAKGRSDRFSQLDEEFHRMLMEFSGNPGAWRIVQNARVHMARLRNLSRPFVNALPHHQRIVEAMSDGDPEAAARAMRDHIAANLAYVEELMRDRGDLFETE